MTSKHEPTTTSDPDDLDDEALFAALENEDDSAYRANRIEQLNTEYASAKNGPAHDPSSFASNPAAGGGTGTIITDTFYPTLTSDQSVLGFTTNTHKCVVHFAHPDFARCGVMDEHIRTLATRHYEVKFARVDVRHTPFIVEKLKIKVLPCVIGFKDGLGVERVLGFEGLGSGGRDGKDGFSIAILEKRLLWKGILVQAKIKQGDDDDDDDDDYDSAGSDEDTGRGPRRAIRSGGRLNRNDDDDDDDWD